MCRVSMHSAALRPTGSPNKPKSDEVVGNELTVVLAGFFESQEKDDELLPPVCHLHKIVRFEFWLHVPVRIVCEGVEPAYAGTEFVESTNLSKNTRYDTTKSEAGS